MSKRGLLTAICAVAIGFTANQANAQAAAIGNAIYNATNNAQFSACQSGLTGLSAEQVNRIGAMATNNMIGYYQRVSVEKDANLSSVFDGSKKSRWVNGGVEFLIRNQTVTDPFAYNSGNLLVKIPIVLMVGGFGANARGAWEVTDAAGKHIGYYLVDFKQTSDWKPISIELIPAGASAPVVKPYCVVPGDVEANLKAAKNIPDKEIAKIAKKAKPIASCMQGADCDDKWARVRKWVQEKSAFPLIRDTDTLLLTDGPVSANVSLAYVVTLDAPSADGKRAIRFRAWCGNMFICFPSPGKTGDEFKQLLN
ncbi:MAG: hypothetical protein ACKOQM_01650 [Novosphingobium sp.]